MAVFWKRYAFSGTLSIESGWIAVGPIEDPPNPDLSSRLDSSIGLNAATWLVSAVPGRMGRHIDAMKSHTRHKTDVMHCRSFCMYGVARGLMYLLYPPLLLC